MTTRPAIAPAWNRGRLTTTHGALRLPSWTAWRGSPWGCDPSSPRDRAPGPARRCAARTSSSSAAAPPTGRSRLAVAGARPVGLDLSDRQLEHARRLMAEAGLDFPLLHASAEAVRCPTRSFDIVFCDHGAMTFADPYRTVPEAARLLRPGGLLAFSHGIGDRSTWPGPTTPSAPERPLVARLLRAAPARVERRGRVPAALRRMDPPVPGQRLRVIEDLLEPRPGRGRDEHLPRCRNARRSRRWPAESIWRLRKA